MNKNKKILNRVLSMVLVVVMAATAIPFNVFATDVMNSTCKHLDVVKVNEVKATCTEEGKKEHYSCTACSKKFGDAKATIEVRVDELVISTIPHDGYSEKGYDATCTKPGVKTYVGCNSCGKLFTDKDFKIEITVADTVIAEMGHDYVLNTEKSIEATCRKAGENLYECTRCSEVKSEKVDKLPHTEVEIPGRESTCTLNGFSAGKKCSVCGMVTEEQVELMRLEHNYVLNESKSTPATCEEKGVKFYECSMCFESKIEEIDAVGHKEKVVAEEIVPTCTKGGQSEGIICEVCNKTLKTSLTRPALGHTMVTETVPATTKKDGIVKTYCSVCNVESDSAVIEKIASIKLSSSKVVYNGKVRTPSVIVTDDEGNKLVKGTDFTVTYASGRKAPGKYAIKVTFIGKYSGTKTLNFVITPSKTSKITVTQSNANVKLQWNKVTGATGYRVYVYNTTTKAWKLLGETSKNTFTVKNVTNGKSYVYAVKAYAEKDGSKIYSTVFTQIKTVKLATPSLKATAGKKMFTLKWNNIKGESGYQVWYSTSKNGTYKKLANVYDDDFTKTGLKTGSTYYVKVRAYKTLDVGNYAYSAFSSIKTITVK